MRYLCEIEKLSDENFHRYHSTFLNSKNTIQLLPEEVPKVKEDLIRSQLLEIIKVGKLYHDPEEVVRGGLDIHELNELLDYQDITRYYGNNLPEQKQSMHAISKMIIAKKKVDFSDPKQVHKYEKRLAKFIKEWGEKNYIPKFLSPHSAQLDPFLLRADIQSWKQLQFDFKPVTSIVSRGFLTEFLAEKDDEKHVYEEVAKNLNSKETKKKIWESADILRLTTAEREELGIRYEIANQMAAVRKKRWNYTTPIEVIDTFNDVWEREFITEFEYFLRNSKMEAVLRNRAKFPHLIVPCFEPEDVFASEKVEEDFEFLLAEKEYGAITEAEMEHFEDDEQIIEEYEEFWEDWFKKEFCVTFEDHVLQHFKAKYVQEERKITFREFRKLALAYQYKSVNENLPVLVEDEFSHIYGHFFYKGCELHGLIRSEVIDELLFQEKSMGFWIKYQEYWTKIMVQEEESHWKTLTDSQKEEINRGEKYLLSKNRRAVDVHQKICESLRQRYYHPWSKGSFEIPTCPRQMKPVNFI